MSRKVKEMIKNLLKQNMFTKSIGLKISDSRRIKAANKYYNEVKTQPKTILFSSYMGREYSCSPRQIYEAMLKDPFFDDYRFIWVFNKNSVESLSKLPILERAEICTFLSPEYFRIIYEAKYWVVNSRMKTYLKKKPEQVYIQTWHGTPYKKIGADITVKGVNAKYNNKELTNLYEVDAAKYDYMPSPSKFYQDKITSAFNLKAINNADIFLDIGYPRNDFLFNYNSSDIDKTKETLGITSNKKIILYAPTWRDNKYDSVLGYVDDFSVNFNYLKEQLGDEYIIIYKPHYFIANSFDFSKFEGFLYNGNLVSDINELFVTADILVTDYSSVFFDYAVLQRKIVFFMYDYEFYRNEVRGFYLEDDELPGNIAYNEKDLVREIKNNTLDAERIARTKQNFNSFEDGLASQRLIDIVFKNNKNI